MNVNVINKEKGKKEKKERQNYMYILWIVAEFGLTQNRSSPSDPRNILCQEAIISCILFLQLTANLGIKRNLHLAMT